MRTILSAILLLCIGCSFQATNSYNENVGIDDAKAVSEMKQYQELYDTVMRLWPVPYKELTIETTYGIAHIIYSGNEKSKPVVMLHGMNASSTMWYPNVGPLVTDYRIYAIDDLTEPGRSELLEPIDYIEDLISWYIEILDQLDIQNFILIGASKGGWLAVKLALRIPHRVEKMVLLSPLQTFSNISPSLKFISAIRFALNPTRKTMQTALQSMSSNSSKIDRRYIDQFLMGSQMAENSGIIFKFRLFKRKELEILEMPVLILIGDEDIINKKSVVKKANKFIRGAETFIINDAGHFLSMDQTEATNNKIKEFMNSPKSALINPIESDQ